MFVLVLIFQSPRVQAGRLGRDGEFWRDAPVFHDPAALAERGAIWDALEVARAERGATWDALEDARHEILEAADEAATAAGPAAFTPFSRRIYTNFKRELSRHPAAIQERTETRKLTL